MLNHQNNVYIEHIENTEHAEQTEQTGQIQSIHQILRETDQEMLLNCFEDKKERSKFIKKTFGLFMFSIFTTLSSCLAFKYTSGSKSFISSELGKIITIAAIVSTIITVFISICCNNLLKKAYIKYVIYIIFTFGVSWLIGMYGIIVESNLLISAIIITTGTTTSLSLYAVTTETDFTSRTEYYIVSVIVIILTVTINIFLYNSTFQLLIIFFGCLLFSFMIVYDIQMIIAQKHIKHKFSTNDYVLAAMSLYIDNVNLFIYVIDCLLLTDNN